MSKQIALTQGKFATVDDTDFEWLNQYSWNVQRRYAARSFRINGKVKTVFMHREIMQPEQGQEIDHIDGNGFNNQRINLRICTRSQNMMNMKKPKDGRSEFKGITLFRGKQWMAQIGVNGRNIYIGMFDDPVSAAKAYNEAALKYHGEFARLNEIPK